MDPREQLFGLMAVAEEHQKAVKGALEGLASEREKLAEERDALAEAADQVVGLADEVKQAATEVAPTLRAAVDAAVDAAVQRSLASASDTATKALDEACKSIVASLSTMARTANLAELKLSGAVASFNWKWATVAGLSAAGCIAAVLLAAWISVWWERHQLEEMAEQRAALRKEVAELQANAEEWAKRGGRAKLVTCGEKGRLCVRVDKTAGYGKDADYFVLRGY